MPFEGLPLIGEDLKLSKEDVARIIVDEEDIILADYDYNINAIKQLRDPLVTNEQKVYKEALNKSISISKLMEESNNVVLEENVTIETELTKELELDLVKEEEIKLFIENRPVVNPIYDLSVIPQSSTDLVPINFYNQPSSIVIYEDYTKVYDFSDAIIKAEETSGIKILDLKLINKLSTELQIKKELEDIKSLKPLIKRRITRGKLQFTRFSQLINQYKLERTIQKEATNEKISKYENIDIILDNFNGAVVHPESKSKLDAKQSLDRIEHIKTVIHYLNS